MKRPPFKIDGRSGQMRYIDRHGKPAWWTGRVAYIFGSRLPQAVLMGGHDFKVNLTGSQTWHRIEMSPEEAYDRLNGFPMLGILRKVLDCRERAGLPPLQPEKTHA